MKVRWGLGHQWEFASGVVLKGWEEKQQQQMSVCPQAETLMMVKRTLSETIGGCINVHKLKKALGYF